MAAVLLPGVAAAAPNAPASGNKNNWGQFVSSRSEMLERFAAPIENCFERDDPWIDPNSPMFNGCADWHSAVHAAYSLYLIYRETGDIRFLNSAESKIKPELVAAELEYMKTKLFNSENPYGFAWFLALTKVREEVTGKHDLRPLADFAAQRIQQLVQSLTPQQARTRALSPAHSNLIWGLIHLQLWAEYTKNAELTAFVQQKAMPILMDPELDRLCPVTADTGTDPRDFFPPCLLRMAGVAQIWDVPPSRLDAWVSERVPADFWVNRVTDPKQDHVYAMNFSRAYALWHIWQATHNVRYRQNYTDLLTYQFSRPELWGLESPGSQPYNFNPPFPPGYGVWHFVAQFGVRALAQSYGGPGQPPR